MCAWNANFDILQTRHQSALKSPFFCWLSTRVYNIILNFTCRIVRSVAQVGTLVYSSRRHLTVNKFIDFWMIFFFRFFCSTRLSDLRKDLGRGCVWRAILRTFCSRIQLHKFVRIVLIKKMRAIKLYIHRAFAVCICVCV